MILLDRLGNAALWLQNQLRPPKPQPQLVPAAITLLTAPRDEPALTRRPDLTRRQ